MCPVIGYVTIIAAKWLQSQGARMRPLIDYVTIKTAMNTGGVYPEVHKSRKTSSSRVA